MHRGGRFSRLNPPTLLVLLITWSRQLRSSQLRAKASRQNTKKVVPKERVGPRARFRNGFRIPCDASVRVWGGGVPPRHVLPAPKVDAISASTGAQHFADNEGEQRCLHARLGTPHGILTACSQQVERERKGGKGRGAGKGGATGH